jgi:hypothetical protein
MIRRRSYVLFFLLLPFLSHCGNTGDASSELQYKARADLQPSWSNTAACFRVTAKDDPLLLRSSPGGTIKSSNAFGRLLWVEKTPPSHVSFEFVEVNNLALHPVYDPNYSGWSSKYYLEHREIPYEECKGFKFD